DIGTAVEHDSMPRPERRRDGSPSCRPDGSTPSYVHATTHVSEETAVTDTHGLSILVVEDEPDSCESLARVLLMDGHRVSVAAEGPDALALAAEYPPDVVFLDIALPGMSGYEVARRLRGLTPKRPLLVAVTGLGRDCDKRASAEAGIDLHLVKPADPEQM